MENDASASPSIESDSKREPKSVKTSVANTIIDTINNNINCLIERIQSESALDESSLPSPKAMLDTIMPCERLCQNFRHLADDDLLRTQIKLEQHATEPKLGGLSPCDEHSLMDGIDLGEQFPLNLKSLKGASAGNNCGKATAGGLAAHTNLEKMDQFKDAEDFGQCDSPKAKKIFMNMLDQMHHSPPTSTKSAKLKTSSDGGTKALNLSSPSSYNSSSPSSTSSLSSTSNVHHQKTAMSGQALNGSMHELLNLPNFSHLQQMPSLGAGMSSLQHRSTPLTLGGMGPGSPLMAGGVLLGLGLPQSPQLPQLILTSGQLVQGIQGAQVLIPTPQGITSQTILTIPVSQQLPTNLSMDQLLQSLSAVSHKQQHQQQQAEQAANTNHVLSNVPNMSPNPILLNSHLLASGAQQLLSIQPQLMAFQQQQQQQQQQHEAHSFYQHHQHQQHQHHHRKSQPSQHRGEGAESPSMVSRKEAAASGMTQFKMRSREMSKRLSRMSSARPLNGHGDLMAAHHATSGSGSGNASPTVHRIPTTNGETQLSPSKPVTASHETSSPSTKRFQSPTPPSPSPHHNQQQQQHQQPQQKLEFRAMRELLADDRHSDFGSMDTLPPPSVDEKKQSRDVEMREQKGEEEEAAEEERQSPFAGGGQQQEAQTIQISPSPVNLSNDSNSGDGHFDGGNREDTSASGQREPLPEGIDLDEINEFAQAFKLQRLSLGLTQTQVGQALSVTEGPAYSQSAICSALAARMYAAVQLSSQQQQMFEKLDITPKSAQKIKPVLEQWMKEAKGRFKMGENPLTEFMGVETSKKRKRRTSFTPHALEILNSSFERNTHPSGTDITSLAQALGYEREVIRIWFCNKRQALKNTVRMMSKGMPN